MLILNRFLERDMKPSMIVLVARITLGLLGAGALATLSAIAGNAPIDPPSMKVRLNDLDLASSSGIARLYRRIAYATENVCGPQFVTGSRIPLPAFVACRAKAMGNAIATIDRPELTRYYRRERQTTLQDTATVLRRH
jgi:UrcA family protein